jgi:DNA-binding beta-propeller fold protein YncE
MSRLAAALAGASLLVVAAGAAQAPAPSGPYAVLKTARVGGEGGWDYIYADVAGRRLYIPRGGVAGGSVTPRLTIFDLDTLRPVGEIPGIGGHGAVVDPVSGHGFVSGNPISMFDTKTLTVTKSIDPGSASPDGIVFDAYNQRVYVFSHPTKDATVIDARTGAVLGRIALGGVPEEGVPDGHGKLYVVMQDARGSVTVVDVTAMKAIAHYPLGDKGGCNGLALDVKNHVLFAACARSGRATEQTPPPGPPRPQDPMMVILNADNGRIFTSLPLAGGSDGAVFNPDTGETFTTHGNGTLTVVKETSPTRFEVEENLNTMNGARTVTLDRRTGRLFTMSQEFTLPDRSAARGTPPARGRGGRGPAVPGSFTILMIGK